MLHCCNLWFVICCLIKIIKSGNHKITRYFKSMLLCCTAHTCCNIIICTHKAFRKWSSRFYPFINISHTCAKIIITKHIHIVCKRYPIILHCLFKGLKSNQIFIMIYRSARKHKASAIVYFIQMINHFTKQLFIVITNIIESIFCISYAHYRYFQHL